MQPHKLRLSDIPDEILFQIFLYLDSKTFIKIYLVSKQFEQVRRAVLSSSDIPEQIISALFRNSRKYILMSKDKWIKFYDDIQRLDEYKRHTRSYVKYQDHEKLLLAFINLQAISVINKNTAQFPYIYSVFYPKPYGKLCLFLLGICVFGYGMTYNIQGLIVLSFTLMAFATLKDQISLEVFGFSSKKNNKIANETTTVNKTIAYQFSKNQDFQYFKNIYSQRKLLLSKKIEKFRNDKKNNNDQKIDTENLNDETENEGIEYDLSKFDMLMDDYENLTEPYIKKTN